VIIEILLHAYFEYFLDSGIAHFFKEILLSNMGNQPPQQFNNEQFHNYSRMPENAHGVTKCSSRIKEGENQF